jgi:hypothetical protein
MTREMEMGAHQRITVDAVVHRGEPLCQNRYTSGHTYRPFVGCASANNLLFACPCVGRMCIAHQYTSMRTGAQCAAQLRMGVSRFSQSIMTGASAK